ncbi:hypothetical protein NDU88_005251 [Pleurodeles waltl]|uniref:Uncharacterized protein n=1 Tax=Pleurodeles waltl TaxID=8319 RepID=A0AAV7WYZ9_PLEWA|nr:hypothetical protein NDU88_005251 [Pleurodeles waltl]
MRLGAREPQERSREKGALRQAPTSSAQSNRDHQDSPNAKEGQGTNPHLARRKNQTGRAWTRAKQQEERLVEPEVGVGAMAWDLRMKQKDELLPPDWFYSNKLTGSEESQGLMADHLLWIAYHTHKLV